MIVCKHNGSMKEERDEMLAGALAKGQKAQSEFESKRFLSQYGIPVNREFLCTLLKKQQLRPRRSVILLL